MGTKKILIVYYSRTGNTKRVALDLASKLNADIEEIVDKKSRKGFFGYLFGGRDAARKFRTEIAAPANDPAHYDITIVGTPVWAWGMTPAVRTYIERFKDRFGTVAYFVTSGGTNAQKTVTGMERLSGKTAIAYAGFVQKELKDGALYEAKLTGFADELTAG